MDLEAWLDQHDASITETIRRCGWVVHYIGGEACITPGCDCPPGDGPPFAYTTGLFGLGHPELLILGVDPPSASTVIGTLGERIRSGENLIPGMPVVVTGWPHHIVPETVPNPGDILFEANRFYRRPSEHSVPALQLTYDDDQGRFPWDDGYATPELQPRPGTFTA
jgi:hypothetical protein